MRFLKKVLHHNLQHVFALRTVHPHTVQIDYTGFNINTKIRNLTLKRLGLAFNLFDEKMFG